MTGFAKRGLLHTSNLLTLITHSFRLEMAIDLKLVSIEQQHSLVDGESFRLICFVNTELWSSGFIELDVCGRPPIRKSGHIYVMLYV